LTDLGRDPDHIGIDAEACWEENEEGVFLLSMRAKAAILVGGLCVFGAVSVSRTASRIHLTAGFVVLSLALLVSLVLCSRLLRNRLEGVLLALSSAPNHDEEPRGRKVASGRLILLFFGFLGLANLGQLPDAVSSEGLWGGSAKGILGLIQIWIGFTESWKEDARLRVSRRACYLCLVAGLWAIVPPLVHYLAMDLRLFRGVEVINWSALLSLFAGFGMLPFLTGPAGWGLMFVALFRLWRSRREGPMVDLEEFLRGLAQPIGACLLIIGFLFLMTLLSAVSSDSSHVGKILAVAVLGTGALLSFCVAFPLCQGLWPKAFRWRMALLLLFWIACQVFLLILLSLYRYWYDWPLLLRLVEMSQVLAAVALLGLLLSMLYVLLTKPRRIERQHMKRIGIILGLLFLGGWFVAAVAFA
jgi:hypothetical protein